MGQRIHAHFHPRAYDSNSSHSTHTFHWASEPWSVISITGCSTSADLSEGVNIPAVSENDAQKMIQAAHLLFKDCGAAYMP